MRSKASRWPKLGPGFLGLVAVGSGIALTILVGFVVLPDDDAAPVTDALWIGDSFTAGTGAPSESGSEACLTSDELGWACRVDAQGGTGFLASGRSNSVDFEALPDRLDDIARQLPVDVLVVDAGRNDLGRPLPQLREAISTYLADLMEASPGADLVVVVPYYMGLQGSPFDGALADFLRMEVRQYDGHVIDPAGEGWISPDTSGELVIEDGVHPNPAGHAYIAENLAREIRRLDLPS